MKIGIVTYFHPINYGAFLQSYALSSRLNQIDGVTAEVINFRYPIEDQWYSRKSFKYLQKNHFNFRKIHFEKILDKAFVRDLTKLKLSEEEIVSDSIELFTKKYSGKYDILIAGSDEIWKANGYRKFPTVYWLPGNLGCRKLSYAASARIDFSKLSKENQKKISDYLNEFEVIGVRDNNTFNEVKKYVFSPERVKLCCDPVFVYDFEPNRERGRKILHERFGVDISKPVIGKMMNGAAIDNALIKLSRAESYEMVSLYQYTKGFINAPDISPLEWIHVIAGFDFLLTRFFHATSFALICGTPFISIDTHAHNINDSKIYDLLKHFGKEDRCISNIDSITGDDSLSKIIKNAVKFGREDNGEQIAAFRKEFEAYLKFAQII